MWRCNNINVRVNEMFSVFSKFIFFLRLFSWPLFWRADSGDRQENLGEREGTMTCDKGPGSDLNPRHTFLNKLFCTFKGVSGQRKTTPLLQGSQGYTTKILRSSSNNGKNIIYIVLQEKIDKTLLPYDAPCYKL